MPSESWRSDSRAKPHGCLVFCWCVRLQMCWCVVVSLQSVRGMLENPTEAVNELSYFDCIDSVMENSKVPTYVIHSIHFVLPSHFFIRCLLPYWSDTCSLYPLQRTWLNMLPRLIVFLKKMRPCIPRINLKDIKYMSRTSVDMERKKHFQ